MKRLFLLIMTLCICLGIQGHLKHDYYFEQLTIAEGLSQNHITCIHQDSQGFIWFGTQNGLNKYDGYQIKEYNSNPSLKNSLSNNYVVSLYSDSYGHLWVGTSDGLCLYHPHTDDLESFDFSHFPNNRPEDRNILSIYEDKNQTIWIGSAGGMIYTYDLKTAQLDDFSYTLQWAPVTAFTECRDSLLIGCAEWGIMHVDMTKKQVYRTSTDSLYKDVFVTSFLKNKEEGTIWIGDRKRGLMKYGEKETIATVPNVKSLSWLSESSLMVATENDGLFEFDIHSMKSMQKEANLNSESITCLYKDNTGILWVGTTNGGVNKFDPNRNHFKYVPLNDEELSHISIYSVLALSELDEQHLLIGLDNKGLYTYNKQTGGTGPYHQSKIYPELKNMPINSVLCDSRGFTWIGTYCRSVKILGPESERNVIKRLINEQIDPASTIKFFYEDTKHRIWIATSQGSVFSYYPETRKMIRHHKAFNTYMNPNIIFSLFEDKEGRIWAGSMCGLYCYDEKKEDFCQVYIPVKENLFDHRNLIIPIAQVDDCFWLGTQNGLISYEYKTKKATIYTVNEGLPGNKIKGLLFDAKGRHLWISTDKGLSCLDLNCTVFSNYGVIDGIVNREFNDMSFLCDKNGEFFFGSVNGIYHFRPEQIKTNPNIPRVIITGYQLYDNTRMRTGMREVHTIPIFGQEEIYIPYSESIFSIDYVGLNYTNTDKNQYAYRLENYDNKWRYVGGQRMATFTNLDPGIYYFHVMASNNDGVWNKEGTTLKIIVLPPWWKTIWAYAFYVLAMMGLLYLLVLFYTNRIKMRSQLANEQFERKQLEKLNQLKMNFFSNITHEFRTPLTLILSPLESIINQRVGKSMQSDYLKIIQSNAVKLLKLVNELLDFSKSEAGNFLFKPSYSDLAVVLQNEIHTFRPLAEEKQIHLEYSSADQSLICLADTVIMQKIVSNLLSNAIKHTPENGKINLSLSRIDEIQPIIRVCVSDTGKGIPEDQQDLIFLRFYQMKDDTSTGTGIGLALVKKLVDLHHGIISVESEIGKGSTFIIDIPFIAPPEGVEVFSDEPIRLEIAQPSSIVANEQMANEESNSGRYTILIAEDNKDLRIYITGLLSHQYHILTAGNGKVALELARKEMPDLILSDVLMPEMDGKEFCRQIKRDIHTCHIPFIMLTALVSETNQIEGLGAGADDYLTKPFNPDILLSKLSNMLQSRTLISRRNNTLQAMQPDEVIPEDKDSQFLLNLIEIIKTNLSNPDLKVDDLGEELGMSHTPFYKKIKQLTNQTPNDFLKNIRLEQARKLLSDSDLNISEIAYLTGFSSPKYFRECFRKQFGENPSEFVERVQKS